MNIVLYFVWYAFSTDPANRHVSAIKKNILFAKKTTIKYQNKIIQTSERLKHNWISKQI